MASVAALADTTIVGENEEQLVTMIVDDQLFGIPILQVQDIVEASRITPVPLAPSAIAGVLNLRGRIVTVIDLRKLLGNDEEVPWDSQMGVTVEYKGDLYTLLVDAIGDVRTLPKRDYDNAPSTMDDKIRQICSGIFRLRGNLLVVLDVSRILLPEAIEATPMLSVEDRRARKDAAQAASDGSKAEKGSQLSALMTDLNTYESDFDSGLDYQTGDEDDIKSRKKANRNRRPINERWKEVLDEKSRREGTVAYRMQEPDEEVLEEAREEADDEEKTWEAEWEARQAGEYESRLPEPGADAPEPEGKTDSGETDPSADGSNVAADWWSKMRGKPATEETDVDAAPENLDQDTADADVDAAAPESLDQGIAGAEAGFEGDDATADSFGSESDLEGDDGVTDSFDSESDLEGDDGNTDGLDSGADFEGDDDENPESFDAGADFEADDGNPEDSDSGDEPTDKEK